jgi:hypothetical protein
MNSEPKSLKKRKGRKEIRSLNRKQEQEERHLQLGMPTSDLIEAKKERKISNGHNAAFTFGFSIDAREKRINELKLLMEIEDSPREKTIIKNNLKALLKSSPPKIIEILSSPEPERKNIKPLISSGSSINNSDVSIVRERTTDGQEKWFDNDKNASDYSDDEKYQESVLGGDDNFSNLSPQEDLVLERDNNMSNSLQKDDENSKSYDSESCLYDLATKVKTKSKKSRK